MASAEDLNAWFAENVRRRVADDARPIGTIAELAGFGRQYLHLVISGNANPTLKVVANLSEALGVDHHELLRPPSVDHAR